MVRDKDSAKEYKNLFSRELLTKIDSVLGVQYVATRTINGFWGTKYNPIRTYIDDFARLKDVRDKHKKFLTEADRVNRELSAYQMKLKSLTSPKKRFAGIIKPEDSLPDEEAVIQRKYDKIQPHGRKVDDYVSKLKAKIEATSKFLTAADDFICEFEKLRKTLNIISDANSPRQVKAKLETRLSEMLRVAKQAAKTYSDLYVAVDSYSESDVNLSGLFPVYIRVGQGVVVNDQDELFSFPWLKSFPFRGDIVLMEKADVSGFIVNLAYSMPVGMCNIFAIDTNRFCERVRSISELQESAGLFTPITQVSESNDGSIVSVEGLVKELSGIMNRCVSERQFTHEAPTWKDYVKRGKGKAMPYRVIVIFSLEGIDTRTAAELVRIAQKGRDFGIQFVWTEDAFETSDDRVNEMLNEYRATQEFVLQLPKNEDATPQGLSRCAVTITADKSVPESKLAKLASLLVSAHKNKPQSKARTAVELFDCPVWSSNATNGFDATIGWDEDGSPVKFRLGDSSDALYYALLGGATGSGKSNLLHVLIHSLCYKYSPDELALYLLDFKDGLEFQKYAMGGKAWLPHAKCITTHNNPDYALSLFKFLEDEFRRRKKLYKGISKYEDFRNAGNALPRIVVVIDEFHKIFEGPNGEKITDALTNILKQGRAYGIHLVLSTQTLSNLSVIGLPQMLQQIPIRISLKGTGEERIFADNNYAANELSIGQGILNNAYGGKQANVKFTLPYIDYQGEMERDYRAKLIKATEKFEKTTDCRIFNGSRLPDQPAMLNLDGATDDIEFSLALGLENDFEGSPFVLRFRKCPDENLIVTGEPGDIGATDITGEEVWGGLMASTLKSLAAQNIPTLYYNPQKSTRPGGLPNNVEFVSGRASMQELYAAMKTLSGKEANARVMIVENYELARQLIPGRMTGIMPETPLEILNSAFTWDKPIYLILFMHNYSFVSKNMFGFDSDINVMANCSKRIVFHVDKETMEGIAPRSGKLQTEDAVVYEGITSPEPARTFIPYHA